MRSKKWKLDFWTVITLVVVLLFMIFLVYPLGKLFVSAFCSSTTGKLSMENFATFFVKRQYKAALINSLKIGLLVTFFSLLVGAPLAYILTMYKFKLKKLIDALIVISMLSPPFIGAYSWVLLLGRSGTVTKFLTGLGLPAPTIYGLKGIVFVMTLKLFPYMYMFLSGAFRKLDASLLEAAESMGARPVRRLFGTVLPLVLPTVMAAGLMTFMNGMADFGTPMLIGEGLQVMTTMIYREYIGEVSGTANFAAALALIMALVTAVLFLAQQYVVNRKSYATNSIRPIQPQELSKGKKIVANLFILLTLGLSLIPHFMVVFYAFFKSDTSTYKTQFTLDNYRNVFGSLGISVLNTFRFGITALVIIIVMAMLVAYTSTRRKSVWTRFIDIVSMFPYILPGAVLGITLLLAFNKKPISLLGTSAIMIIAFIIRRMPYTLRSSTAILYQISPAVEEASISLGCPPVRTFFKVTARLMLPGVLSGAILSWVTIINELSASMLLYTGRTMTMSVSIYSLIIRSNMASAAALSTILTATTIVSLLVFFKASGSTEVSA